MFELTKGDAVNAASEAVVRHHVANGGCIDEFKKAIHDCNNYQWVSTGLFSSRVVTPDKEACIRATAALRRCFAGNPEMFKHQYLRRLDEGLDQDLKLSWEQTREEERHEFRWWNGMRRD